MKINKELLKKSKGRIIILEGLWSVGKTTFCLYLQKHHNFHFVQEPNHIKAKLKIKDRKVITNWYFKEHLKNLKKAFELASENKNIAIERSPISSLAFAKAFFDDNLFSNKSVNEVESLLREYKNQPYLVILKHSNLPSLVKLLAKNKRMIIYSDLDFLKKFQRYFCFSVIYWKRRVVLI